MQAPRSEGSAPAAQENVLRLQIAVDHGGLATLGSAPTWAPLWAPADWGANDTKQETL